jgi:hypothetical protein
MHRLAYMLVDDDCVVVNKSYAVGRRARRCTNLVTKVSTLVVDSVVDTTIWVSTTFSLIQLLPKLR